MSAPVTKLDRAKFINRMTWKGAVHLLSGDREAGKTATVVSIIQPVVEGKVPGLPKIEVLTNIPFGCGGIKGRAMPPGVHYVDSIELMYRTVMRVFDENRGKDIRIMVAVDEAQQHMKADNNSDPVNQAFLNLLAIIRKFNMSVWFMSPLSTYLVPKIRQFIKDPKNPGNLNYHWYKDIPRIRKYIEANKLPYHYNQFTTIASKPGVIPLLFFVPKTSWMTKRADLKKGEYAYDDEAAATMKYRYTEGFSDVDLIDAVSGLLKEDAVGAMIEYFRKLDAGTGRVSANPEEVRMREQADRVRRMRDAGMKWDLIVKAENGTAKSTLASRLQKYPGASSKTAEASVNDDERLCGGT